MGCCLRSVSFRFRIVGLWLRILGLSRVFFLIQQVLDCVLGQGFLDYSWRVMKFVFGVMISFLIKMKYKRENRKNIYLSVFYFGFQLCRCVLGYEVKCVFFYGLQLKDLKVIVFSIGRIGIWRLFGYVCGISFFRVF